MKRYIKKKNYLNTAKNIYIEFWQTSLTEASITSYIISYKSTLKTVQFAVDTEIIDTTLSTQLKFKIMKKKTETVNILRRKQQQ